MREIKSRRRFHADDAKGVHVVALSHRDVFAGAEYMLAEAVAGFVRLIARNVIVKPPRPARRAREMADVDFLIGPKPYGGALIAVRAPQIWIHTPLGVERRNEIIADLAGAVRVTGLARQFQPNAPKTRGQGMFLRWRHILLPGQVKRICARRLHCIDLNQVTRAAQLGYVA